MKYSLGALALMFALTASWAISTNNAIVSMNEEVSEKWSQVENVYQRRADLIPNLVNTVKGYAKHESTVLEAVTRARASVGQVRVNKPGDIAQFDKAQSDLSSALSRLMVISEKYPDLKADKSFLELQSQLEGTENRISVERMRFNESAKIYNIYIKKFPQSFIAGYRNFQERAYFASEAGAKSAPKVQF